VPEDRTLVAQAIEEALRWDGSVLASQRLHVAAPVGMNGRPPDRDVEPTGASFGAISRTTLGGS